MPINTWGTSNQTINSPVWQGNSAMQPVMQLGDTGQLNLDEPVQSIVPNLAIDLPTTDSSSVTVRQLMTMSSGLGYDDPWADRKLNASFEEMEHIFSAGLRFSAAPEMHYMYSSYGYAILGRVIDNVTGETFRDFITRNVLIPLEMNNTVWDVPTDNFAQPYRVVDGRAVIDEPRLIDHGGFASMGGLWSNVEDILTWSRFLLDAYPARDGAIERF